MPDFPPTIIVVHPKERRGKCTVQSLRHKSGFEFRTFPHCGDDSWDNYVQLGLNGPLLTRSDRDCGLLVLDGTWRLLERMAPHFADVPVRSLPACQTAYPRTSKLFNDPEPGLATIEALYVAYTILERPTRGLLDNYRWADTFLTRNADLLGGNRTQQT